METVILTVVVVGLVGLAVWYYNRDAKNLDVNNNDGRVDVQDAAQALRTTAQGITQDVRDTRDAALIASAETAMKAAGVMEVAAKTTKQAAKKTAAKVTTAKKATAGKPRKTK